MFQFRLALDGNENNKKQKASTQPHKESLRITALNGLLCAVQRFKSFKYVIIYKYFLLSALSYCVFSIR